MKRALVAVSFELLEQVMCLPPGLKIIRVNSDVRHPCSFVLTCEGEALPDNCKVVSDLNPIPFVRAMVHSENGEFSHYTFE